MKTNSVVGSHDISDIHQLQDLAAVLARQLRAGDTILLRGDVGAGKTTLTQFLGKALGVKDRITSPTYTFIGEYEVQSNSSITKLVHMDLYRMGQLDRDIPLNNEYVQEVITSARDDKAVVIIEWAEKLQQLPIAEYWDITMKPGDTPQGRIVTVHHVQ